MKELRPYQSQALSECLVALKQSDEPVLLMASVGSGKSLMISDLLLKFENLGKRALCIVNNAELVRNNAETFREQGGNPSIYCSALGERSIRGQVVFGTPQSVLNGIKRGRLIADVRFNIIIVDEAHAINYQDHKTTFMRILRHYKNSYPDMRVLGATGTAFRYKGEAIVGKHCLFQKQVGNITTAWLIENGYLVRPTFDVDKENTIDFSSVRLNQMGKFDNKQLEQVIENNHRLTGEILTRLVDIMESQKRYGCFIFCCTRRHCDEAYAALPKNQAAIITGETPQKERLEILDKARKGIIKYLINVQVLTVGVDVPGYDTLLFLRPTESLVLAVQMIGRALRLFPYKYDALIIDCAGNLERHRDWDDPMILDAIKQIDNDEEDLIFECPDCMTMNSFHARRCRGIINKKRCDYYFEWKDCPECEKQNDIVSRSCRWCGHELIDPNKKLNTTPFAAQTMTVVVSQAKYWLQEHNDKIQFKASYAYKIDGERHSNIAYEFFSPSSSDKAKNMFYGLFVKKHIKDSSFWYPHLQNPVYLKAMLQHIESPTELLLKLDGGQWKIKDKLFPNQDNAQ